MTKEATFKTKHNYDHVGRPEIVSYLKPASSEAIFSTGKSEGIKKRSHKNLLGLIDLEILPKAQQTQGIEAINELQNLGSWSNLVLVVFGKGGEIHVTT